MLEAFYDKYESEEFEVIAIINNCIGTCSNTRLKFLRNDCLDYWVKGLRHW